MNLSNRRGLVAGVALGVCLVTGAVLMAQQTPSAPQMPTSPEYFVTGDEKAASLWVREGASIRFVADARKSDRPKPPEGSSKRGDQ